MALSKVYTFGHRPFAPRTPTPPVTSSEFWMIEPEIAFADLDGRRRDWPESFLKSIFRTRAGGACRRHEPSLTQRIDKELRRRAWRHSSTPPNSSVMDYGEAIRILEKALGQKKKKKSFEFELKWGVDLQSEHERFLTEKHVKVGR